MITKWNIMSLIHFFTFMREFVRSPESVGSVAPSSRALATAMVADLNWDELHTIVELGPGTGSISRLISQQLPESRRYLALEPNLRFRHILSTQFEQIELAPHFAHELPQLITPGSAQAIICGLPFSLFSWEEIQDIVNAVYHSLAEDGVFRCFGYHHTRFLPKVQRLIRYLESNFATTNQTTVIRNVPPAFILHCQKNTRAS
jgi:phospholipid N-methyltransferase